MIVKYLAEAFPLEASPADVPPGMLVIVIEHVNVAPGRDGSEPQLSPLTPFPAVTAEAITPSGRTSETVADVPDDVVPLLPM